MERQQQNKRVRACEPTVADVMHFGRIIMEKDPFKERAPQVEDHAFRAMFGCGDHIVLALWIKLLEKDLIPDGGTMTHLLWALMYAKQYAKWSTMRRLTGTDPKTLRKWIELFFDAIASLESDMIVWSDRFEGDIQNDCLTSVDTTDFQIPYYGRKFKSHKFKFGSALRYEIALCILSGVTVWINGPYEPGMWNDLMIFRNAMLSELEDGERVEADDGYRGESPRYIKCPASIGRQEEMEQAAAFVRHRQETINKRFKQWGILKQVYRGDIAHHGRIFRVVAIVTQLAILHGEPLFGVDYKDPDFDNLYFDDGDVSDDDEA